MLLKLLFLIFCTEIFMIDASNETMRELRVLFTRYLPHVNYMCGNFPTLSVTPGCPLPGMSVEMLNLLKQVPNMQTTVVTIDDPSIEYGIVEDGRPTGMLQLVKNGTVDTIAMSYTGYAELMDMFEFTEPLFFSVARIIERRRINSFDQYLAFFHSYKDSAWLGIGLMLIIQALFGIMVQRVEYKLHQKSQVNYMETVWNIIRFQLMQPAPFESKMLSAKISMFMYSLVQCTVIMGVLSSYILSTLITPERPNRIETGSDVIKLLNSSKIHIVERETNIQLKRILDGFARVDDVDIDLILEKNPVRIAYSNTEALEMLDQEGAIMIKFDDDELTFFANQMCSVFKNPEPIEILQSGFVFRKNFTLFPEINQVLKNELFRRKRIWQKYMKSWYKELECDGKVRRSKALPYFGLAIFLVAFNCFSIIIFFAEISVKWFEINF